MISKVAFVTSAAKGLGYTTVKALVQRGWDVFFTYGSSAEEAAELVQFAVDRGRRAVALTVDLLDKQAVLAAVRECQQKLGAITAFVHNFGPFVFERHLLSDYTDEMWHHMLDGNLTNFVWVYREVVPEMRRCGFGRIVTVGYDGAGDATGWRFRAAYAAAKAGLAALTRSISKEERQNGITANMVCPGDIRGAHKMEMVAEVQGDDPPGNRPPVGEDVGRLVAFLCEVESQQLSGTVTPVDGGFDILADDDSKLPVVEPQVFAVGETVWVAPWSALAEIRDVVQTPKRYREYVTEGADGRSGRFTAFQLAAFASCSGSDADG